MNGKIPDFLDVEMLKRSDSVWAKKLLDALKRKLEKEGGSLDSVEDSDEMKDYYREVLKEMEDESKLWLVLDYRLFKLLEPYGVKMYRYLSIGGMKYFEKDKFIHFLERAAKELSISYRFEKFLNNAELVVWTFV